MGDESFVLIVYSIDFVALLFPYSLPRRRYQASLRNKLLRNIFCPPCPPLYASIQGARKTKGVVSDTLLLRLLGWKMGFEPTTLGTTILYSNRLSYIHHNRLDFRIGVQIYTLFSIVQNFCKIFLVANSLCSNIY